MRLLRVVAAGLSALAAGSPAGAADRAPRSSAPSPAADLSACPDHAFVRLPGTTSCLRVSARLRLDAGLAVAAPGRRPVTATSARATTTLEVRDTTSWGDLRTAMRFTLERGPDGSAQRTTPTLDYAVISLAGLTAGRTDSPFLGAWPLGGVSLVGGGINGRGGDFGSVQLAGATWRPADGVSVTLAAEDPGDRDTWLGNATTARPRLPDLTAALRLDAADWAMQLSGAVRQLQPAQPALAGVTGYALQLGLQRHLPGPGAGGAAGTTVAVQLAYAQGGNTFTGWSYAVAGGFEPWLYDAWSDGTRLHRTATLSLGAGVRVGWLQRLSTSLFGSLGLAQQAGPGGDVAAWTLGANVVVSPVRDLELAAELVATGLVRRRPWTADRPGTPQGFTSALLRLRLQRDM